ncbi:unnamed protein product [Echinostoma caproni]|uniref:Uncharacterized protein n=1 Tax=Echinostoma caproni TaxID=27848 RepID=A0A183BAC5_9TREM|nr:unnamed protein product [Echinostoma caproni]
MPPLDLPDLDACGVTFLRNSWSSRPGLVFVPNPGRRFGVFASNVAELRFSDTLSSEEVPCASFLRLSCSEEADFCATVFRFAAAAGLEAVVVFSAPTTCAPLPLNSRSGFPSGFGVDLLNGVPFGPCAPFGVQT